MSPRPEPELFELARDAIARSAELRQECRDAIEKAAALAKESVALVAAARRRPG